MLCDICITHTELSFSSHRGLWIPVERKSYRGHSGVYLLLWWERTCPQTKTGKKLSVKLLWDRYVYSSHIDETAFLLHSFETLHHGQIHEGTFRRTYRLVGKQEISSDNNWRETF